MKVMLGHIDICMTNNTLNCCQIHSQGLHISMSIFCSSIMLPPFILFFGAVAPNSPPRGRFGAFGAGSRTTHRVHRQSRSCSSPGSDRRCPGTSRPWCHGRSSWSQSDAIFFVMGSFKTAGNSPSVMQNFPVFSCIFCQGIIRAFMLVIPKKKCYHKNAKLGKGG